MELFSLDSVMFDIFTFKVDFSETYPRQALPIASKLENFLVKDTLRPPYKAPAMGNRENAPPPRPPPPPVTKNLVTALFGVLGRQPLIINSAIKNQASSTFDFRLQMTVFYCFWWPTKAPHIDVIVPYFVYCEGRSRRK